MQRLIYIKQYKLRSEVNVDTTASPDSDRHLWVDHGIFLWQLRVFPTACIAMNLHYALRVALIGAGTFCGDIAYANFNLPGNDPAVPAYRKSCRVVAAATVPACMSAV